MPFSAIEPRIDSQPSGLAVSVYRDAGAERERCERELLGAGFPLPLYDRCAWARTDRQAGSWFVAVRDGEGRCVAGFALEVYRSRALPGHLLLRANRFGGNLSPEVRDAALTAFTDLARREARVLRVSVRVFARDDVRAPLGQALAGLGYRRLEQIRLYEQTLALDLTPDEATVFASFHKTARRNIKEVAKHPVELRPITDAAWAARMDDLLRESMERTGGVYEHQDWAARVELGRLCPEGSYLTGLFRTDVAGPASLVAFAWACGHGDHAHYDASGATRSVPFRLSLGYPLLWDMICWAKRNGAKWFDLGGVTLGSVGDQQDRCGGISDFKRYFSRDLITVGEEWELEPHWLRAKAARTVSVGADWLKARRPGKQPGATHAAPAETGDHGKAPEPRPLSRREIAANVLAGTGLHALVRRLRPWQGVLSLAYHRIGEDYLTPFDRELWSATPAAFDAQVRFLKKHFDVISPADLPGVAGQRTGRHVLITFDDGYYDNYKVAFPILKAHHVPATFFVATSFIDNPRPSWYDEIAWMVRTSSRAGIPAGSWLPGPVSFDAPDCRRAVCTLLRRYKSLPGPQTGAYIDFLAEATGSGRCRSMDVRVTWMNWDMLREMKAGGMTFGGHTAKHPVLARLSREEQAREIAECKQRLEVELGGPVTTFSYPNGSTDSFNEDTRACLREQGFEFAFSYYGGLQRFDAWDPYDLKRTAVELYTTPSLFTATMTLPRIFA